MSVIDNVKNIIKNKSVPYNYVVGQKSTGSSPIPFDVKLSIDPDFKKTVIKVGSIFSVGIALGIAAGIYSSKKRSK